MPEPRQLDPVPGSPRDTRRWYDRTSGFYAAIVEDLEFPPTRRAIEWIDPQPDEEFLDVGCGAGKAVVEVAGEISSGGRAIGIDFAPGMCHEAQKAIQTEGVGARSAVICGDGRTLPFPEDRFDGVLSSFVLDLLTREDMDLLLGEIRRVLAPEGRLAIVSLAESDAIATRLYRTLRTAFPTQLDCRPIPVTTILDSAGFEIERTQRYSLYGLPVNIVLAHSRSA